MITKIEFINGDNTIYSNIKNVETIICQKSGKEYYLLWSDCSKLPVEYRADVVKHITLSIGDKS